MIGGRMRGRTVCRSVTAEAERPVRGMPEPADRGEGRRGHDAERPVRQGGDQLNASDPGTLRAWRHGGSSVRGVARHARQAQNFPGNLPKKRCFRRTPAAAPPELPQAGLFRRCLE